MKNNHIRKLIILGLMSAYMSIHGASQLSRISNGLQSTIPSTTHNYETRTQFKPIVLPKNAPIQSHQGSHLSSQFKTKHTVEPQQLVRSQVSRFELPDQPSSQTSRQSTQSNSPATISKGEDYGLKSLRLLEEPGNQNPQIVYQRDISQGKVPQVDATIPRSPHLTGLTFATVTPLRYPHINHKKPRKQSQQKPSLKKNKSKGSDIQKKSSTIYEEAKAPQAIKDRSTSTNKLLNKQVQKVDMPTTSKLAKTVDKETYDMNNDEKIGEDLHTLFNADPDKPSLSTSIAPKEVNTKVTEPIFNEPTTKSEKKGIALILEPSEHNHVVYQRHASSTEPTKPNLSGDTSKNYSILPKPTVNTEFSPVSAQSMPPLDENKKNTQKVSTKDLTGLTFATVTPLPYPHRSDAKPERSQQKPSLKKYRSKPSDIQAEPAPHFKNTPLHPKADPLYSFPSHKNKPRQEQRLSTIYEDLTEAAQAVKDHPKQKNIAAFTKQADKQFKKEEPSIKQTHEEVEELTAAAHIVDTSSSAGQEQAKNLFARTATTISQGLRSAVSVFTAKQASSLKTSSTSKKTNQEITDAEAEVTTAIEGALDAQKTIIKKLETNAVTPEQAAQVEQAQNELSRTQKVWNKIKSIGVKPLIGAAAITTIVLILVDLLTGDIEE
jgi:hypothetical protein